MGQLTEKFKQVARKATLTTVLATTLVAGSGSAFAQTAQAGPPPGPDNTITQTTTHTVVSQYPWRNDPRYQRIVEAYDHQMAARDKQFQANEKNILRQQRGNLEITEANINQSQQNNRNGNWQSMAGYAAQHTQATANYEANVIRAKADLQRQEADLNIQRDNYMRDLDRRFSTSQLYNKGNGPVLNTPWEGDGNYQARMQDFTARQLAQNTQEEGNFTAQMRQLQANQTAEDLNFNAQSINYMRQGGWAMTRFGAQREMLNARHEMDRTSREASYELTIANRELERANFIFNMDSEFAGKPQYKNLVAPQNGAKPGIPPAPRGPQG